MLRSLSDHLTNICVESKRSYNFNCKFTKRYTYICIHTYIHAYIYTTQQIYKSTERRGHPSDMVGWLVKESQQKQMRIKRQQKKKKKQQKTKNKNNIKNG